MPFQSNFNTGTKDATVYVLNVQPVIPIKLTEDLNLITRTIMLNQLWQRLLGLLGRPGV